MTGIVERSNGRWPNVQVRDDEKGIEEKRKEERVSE